MIFYESRIDGSLVGSEGRQKALWGFFFHSTPYKREGDRNGRIQTRAFYRTITGFFRH